MDFLPFTLFFMACLLIFQANVMGKPAQSWPKTCLNQNYCQYLEKPPGYPTEKELSELYKRNKYRIKTAMNETRNRDGSNPCKDEVAVVKDIKMIKDQNNNIRYALYIPNFFTTKTMAFNCKSNYGFLGWLIMIAEPDALTDRQTIHGEAVTNSCLLWNGHVSLDLHTCPMGSAKWTGFSGGCANETLPREIKDKGRFCVQETQLHPYPVLTRDMKDIEIVNLGINSSCSIFQRLK